MLDIAPEVKALKQELFDTVAGHLLRQHEKSTIMGGNSCQYRGHDGLKCAVGILIKDDYYTYHVEGQNVRDIIDQVNGSLGRKLTNDEVSLLNNLQSVHDNADVDHWPVSLKEVARNYELDYSFTDDDEKACFAKRSE
jgi:hypothetical protein